MFFGKVRPPLRRITRPEAADEDEGTGNAIPRRLSIFPTSTLGKGVAKYTQRKRKVPEGGREKVHAKREECPGGTILCS